jgi:hypothetical protein
MAAGSSVLKTDHLINLLIQDSAPSIAPSKALDGAIFVGGLISVALFVVLVGVRPEIQSAISTIRVAFKIFVTASLALLCMALLFRLGRPGLSSRKNSLALLVPAFALVAAVILELYFVPQDEWGARLVGRYARYCMFYIPLLSVAPLAGFLWALSFTAPEKPALAGAAAGLAAGSLAAAMYAWHCPDDSPLFVATWYVLAMSLVTGIGSLIGSRVLRW